MPATSPMTLGDYKQRVAERARKIRQDATTGKMVADTQNPAADQIARAVADGLREMLRAHDWSWLTCRVELGLSSAGTGATCIDADPTRYLLPAYVESLPKTDMQFRWPAGTTGGGDVRLRSYDEVAARAFKDPVSVGPPSVCGCEYQPYGKSALGQTGGIELRVWPKPDRDYTLGFRARVGAVEFAEDQQAGFWPPVHDLTLCDLAVRELFKHDRSAADPAQGRAIAAANEAAAASLALSIQRDDEDYRPGTLGGIAEAGDWPRGRLVQIYDYTSNSTLASVASFN